MKTLNIYQVDAFASKVFQGNPAAVCPLEQWLSDSQMQAIAAENNLSETAFFVPENNDFYIRWFTPTTEVNLCGHATLASASVLFDELGYPHNSISFNSKSGLLSVHKENNLLVLDFPCQTPVPCPIPESIQKAFGTSVQVCLAAEDYVVVLDSEADVRQTIPDMALLRQLDLRGVIITSVSDSCDFVCRFFAPNYGIDEDPVTGSAYTQLTPYWAEKLAKTELSAKQLSDRGGDVLCELKGNRVLIKGEARLYLKGQIYL